MRNYIIFYAAIIVFVVGGIKWTSHVIEKEKQEKLKEINFHQQITALLVQQREVLQANTANKNIVIAIMNIGGIDNSSYLKLNSLTTKYSANTIFFVYTRANKDATEAYFKRVKVAPAFKLIYKARPLVNYIESLKHYFYDQEALDQMARQFYYATTLVISSTGEMKLYKIGYGKDTMDQVDAALK